MLGLKLIHVSKRDPRSKIRFSDLGFQIGLTGKSTKHTVRTIICQKYNTHMDPLFGKLNLLKLNVPFSLDISKPFDNANNGLLTIYSKHIPIGHMKRQL